MRSRPWMKWLIGAGVVVVLAVGGFLVYWNFIKSDAEDPFELTEVETDGTTTETTAAADGADPGISGTWTITTGSEAGYRAEEILFGQSSAATGRTSEVTGSFVIDGTTIEGGDPVTVTLASVESGESLRDNQFRGRIMDVATYPTASFALTEPIELESEPTVGTPITTSATGDLTVKDVTKSVTFEVNAQLLPTGNIEIQGSIPVVWADYNIDDPSGGPAQVGADGAIEFLLQLGR